MKNDPEMDLIRLFAAVGEPGHGDVFVKRVSKRMALLRYARRVTQILLAGVGVAILALLTPWVMDLTGYVALGSNLLANGVTAVIFSPVGWVLGGVAGLFVFLRRRS
jgi:hypothetical protein